MKQKWDIGPHRASQLGVHNPDYVSWFVLLCAADFEAKLAAREDEIEDLKASNFLKVWSQFFFCGSE